MSLKTTREKTDVGYAEMSDVQLAVERDRLAALRTEVRLAQNAVDGEIGARRVLSGLSEAARDALTIRLSGGAAPVGEGAPE